MPRGRIRDHYEPDTTIPYEIRMNSNGGTSMWIKGGKPRRRLAEVRFTLIEGVLYIDVFNLSIYEDFGSEGLAGADCNSSLTAYLDHELATAMARSSKKDHEHFDAGALVSEMIRKQDAA